MPVKVPDVPAVHAASVKAQAPADALDASISFARDHGRSAPRPRGERTFPVPSVNPSDGVVELETDESTVRTPRFDCGGTDR